MYAIRSYYGYGYSVPCNRIEIVEAAHPVPDAAGLAATRRMLDLVSGLGDVITSYSIHYTKLYDPPS